jgi:hypothetical protein
MKIEIEKKLWDIDLINKVHSREIWCRIVDELLQDLSEFTGEQFERKVPLNINVNEPLFSQRVISKRLEKSFFSIPWSGVMSGGVVAQNNNIDDFIVSITFFYLMLVVKKDYI